MAGRVKLRASTSGVAAASSSQQKFHPFILFSDSSPLAFIQHLTRIGFFESLNEHKVTSVSCVTPESYHERIRRDAGLLNTPLLDQLSCTVLGVGSNEERAAAFSDATVEAPAYDAKYLLMEGTTIETLRNVFLLLETGQYVEKLCNVDLNTLFGILGLQDSDYSSMAPACLLKFFHIPPTPEELETDHCEWPTLQRIFNILCNNFFFERKVPVDRCGDLVYLRVDSAALDVIEISCGKKRIPSETIIEPQNVVEIDGVRYIAIMYGTFLNYVLFPWFRNFLVNASQNNGDTL